MSTSAKIRVLYIDGVGPFGGASRSLFEVVRALPPGSVEAYFVVQHGTALRYYERVAEAVVSTRGLTRFDNSRYSHYRGIRWLVLLREVFYLPYTLAALFRAHRRWKQVDIIHQNEIMEILPGLIAKRLFRAPLVVHVRSPQRVDPKSLRTRLIQWLLRAKADAVIAINENTRATLPADLRVEVIQNSFTPSRPAKADDQFATRLRELRPDSLKVGFVGNLHHSKGLFDLLEAAKLLQARGSNVEFVIVGGGTAEDKGVRAWLLKMAGLAQNVHSLLEQEVKEAQLGESFHLMGPTYDIQLVYECIDVIAFPSHYDAPGRPVFEAAFSGVPSIVCVSDPRPDTLIHGETGLAIPARDPAKLAEAILHFAEDRNEVKRMGARARELALANFVPETNAQKLLSLYGRLILGSSRSRPADAQSNSLAQE